MSESEDCDTRRIDGGPGRTVVCVLHNPLKWMNYFC